MNCKYCGSSHVHGRGIKRSRYQCQDCMKWFTVHITPCQFTSPKILFLDIETAPMVVYAFQLKTDYITPDKIITPTFMLSWAAKWYGKDKIMSGVLSPIQVIAHDDIEICKSVHKLLDDADIVVAYNGKRFDFRKLNYRFIVNNLNPPTTYRVVDPITTLRSRFGFDSNRLDFINTMLGISCKTETNFQLWADCVCGNAQALKKMVEYNKNDVVILEQNYLKLLPWISNHPQVATYTNDTETVCKRCSSVNLIRTDKFNFSNLGKYRIYMCSDCKTENTSRINELSKDKRDSLLK